MIWKPKLPTGDVLLKRAQELGVDVEQWEKGTKGELHPPMHSDIQRRVMEAERHVREHNLWIVAVVSMFISVLSAAAAWWAVLHPAPKIDCSQPPSVNQSR